MKYISLTLSFLAGVAVALALPASSETPGFSIPPDATRIPVKLIDLYPNATYKGVPVNDSIIFAEFITWKPTKLTKPIKPVPVKPSTLKKRQSSSYCINAGSGDYWIPLYQLQNGKNDFCNYIQSRGGISNNQEVVWQAAWYHDYSTNQDHRYSHTGSDEVAIKKVSYWLNANSGTAWNWNTCFDLFFNLFYTCQGSNPDSSGGGLYDYWGYSGSFIVIDF
ncbi:hypothetical protein ABW20_dc0109736 [Dactylellina cionopaga]|nr:hypothetical protein ABW20_dc0109736 [Dactylellina cionopaga]